MNTNQRKSLNSLSFVELGRVLNELLSDDEINRYRSNQIVEWIYKKREFDFDNMTNLPIRMRNQLSEKAGVYLPELINTKTSIDGTEKYLMRLRDGAVIEMVLIKEVSKSGKSKRTLCISSQVGCRFACSFCATASLGFKRNLNVEEITGQFLLAEQISGDKLTNLVFMGMGEPLDNYENVCKAIRILQEDRLISFSPRRITVSTCGLVPEIERLSDEGINLKLAVSLNAAEQTLREKIMPITKRYPLSQLKNALLTFQRKNPYRITFEYVMIRNFNMSKSDAQQLMSYLGDVSSKINLIAWNKVTEVKDYEPPLQSEIDKFIRYLSPFTGAITFRKSKGSDIAAACGQLAAKDS